MGKHFLEIKKEREGKRKKDRRERDVYTSGRKEERYIYRKRENGK